MGDTSCPSVRRARLQIGGWKLTIDICKFVTSYGEAAVMRFGRDTVSCMDPLVFEHEDVHLRVDNGILELFRRNRIIGSYRTPLHWAKVRSEVRKGGVTRIHFGNVDELDEPLYATKTDRGHLLATVEIATADEPLYRSFFTELARVSDRPVGA